MIKMHYNETMLIPCIYSESLMYAAKYWGQCVHIEKILLLALKAAILILDNVVA